MTHQRLLTLFILLFSIQGSSQKSKPLTLNAKIIDKNLARVTDSLFAYKYETTNSDYNIFLASLKEINTDLYQRCLVDSNNWPLQYGMPLRTYYHRHPAYNQYPVVNITYESAIEYCKWITVLYNNDPKRKFNKVEFMLPAVKEWVRAGEGGRSQAMFPWNTFYLRNKNGNYMCNMRRINEMSVYRDKDGRVVVADTINFSGSLGDPGVLTANVHSFYPNPFGIYNISGNVAEMTNEKGLTKGGSWNSYGGEVHLISSRVYHQPSPEVGFRVFMRVIEK